MAAQNIHVIHLEVDEDTLEGDYRFLVDDCYVKYVSINGNGILDCEDMCFTPVLIPSLPPFPPGDWNCGHIAKNDNGKAAFAWTRRENLPSIGDPWHPFRANILDLDIKNAFKMQSNVWRVKIPELGDRRVVAKMANFLWEVDYYHFETQANYWIRDMGIAPEFLGHIVEEGRIVGLLVEYIEESRRAGSDDVAACRKLLDERAWLIDWESAVRCDETAQLEEEMQRLESELEDESGKGGGLRIEEDFGFAATQHALYRALSEPKIETPVLHFIGSVDTVVSEERSLRLVEGCVVGEGRGKVVYHPGGHFVPASQKVYQAALVDFIREVLGGGGDGKQGREEEKAEDMDMPF
ncbi:hypothetical protein FH972_023980 [Carpinus fangiana]|uniref:Serine hydrolase domain-containing protein n=1 Tax=Carpinus fangiana TaxID=176857 RepID=A0A5N6KX78_9ROSI|nr:hypothetical protein FH972_023980 [Carpinus fangiana]